MPMTEDKSGTGEKSQSLVGKRLYPPAVVAGYMILASFCVGYVLFGLNLRARGRVAYGRSAIVFGIVSGMVLIVRALTDRLPNAGSMLLFSLVNGIGVYKIEIGAYQQALRAGAIRARWWPPCLILLLVVAIVEAFESWF